MRVYNVKIFTTDLCSWFCLLLFLERLAKKVLIYDYFSRKLKIQCRPITRAHENLSKFGNKKSWCKHIACNFIGKYGAQWPVWKVPQASFAIMEHSKQSGLLWCCCSIFYWYVWLWEVWGKEKHSLLLKEGETVTVTWELQLKPRVIFQLRSQKCFDQC